MCLPFGILCMCVGGVDKLNILDRFGCAFCRRIEERVMRLRKSYYR